MSLDVLVDFHRHDSMKIRSDITRVVVVTPREFVEVSCEKVLFVEYGKIEVVEGWRTVWSRQSQSVLEVENRGVRRRRSFELFVKSNGASSAKGEDGRYCECSVASSMVHMVL